MRLYRIEAGPPAAGVATGITPAKAGGLAGKKDGPPVLYVLFVTITRGHGVREGSNLKSQVSSNSRQWPFCFKQTQFRRPGRGRWGVGRVTNA